MKRFAGAFSVFIVALLIGVSSSIVGADVFVFDRVINYTRSTDSYPYFDYPTDVIATSQGIYIVDKNRFRVVFLPHDLDPSKQKIFGGTFGSASQNLNFPESIAIDEEERYLYVADTKNDVVKRFTISSGEVKVFGSSLLREPYGVAIRNGTLFVSDGAYFMVRVLTTPDRIEYSIGDPATSGLLDYRLKNPRGIFVTDNEIYVADTLNSRVQVFTRNGTFVRRIGTIAGQGRLIQPTDVWVANGRVFVSDTATHRVCVYFINSTFITCIGEYGKENTQFNSPHGVAVFNNLLYVADTNNRRIVVYGIIFHDKPTDAEEYQRVKMRALHSIALFENISHDAAALGVNITSTASEELARAETYARNGSYDRAVEGAQRAALTAEIEYALLQRKILERAYDLSVSIDVLINEIETYRREGMQINETSLVDAQNQLRDALRTNDTRTILFASLHATDTLAQMRTQLQDAESVLKQRSTETLLRVSAAIDSLSLRARGTPFEVSVGELRVHEGMVRALIEGGNSTLAFRYLRTMEQELLDIQRRLTAYETFVRANHTVSQLESELAGVSFIHLLFAPELSLAHENATKARDLLRSDPTAAYNLSEKTLNNVRDSKRKAEWMLIIAGVLIVVSIGALLLVLTRKRPPSQNPEMALGKSEEKSEKPTPTQPSPHAPAEPSSSDTCKTCGTSFTSPGAFCKNCGTKREGR